MKSMLIAGFALVVMSNVASALWFNAYVNAPNQQSCPTDMAFHFMNYRITNYGGTIRNLFLSKTFKPRFKAYTNGVCEYDKEIGTTETIDIGSSFPRGIQQSWTQEISVFVRNDWQRDTEIGNPTPNNFKLTLKP